MIRRLVAMACLAIMLACPGAAWSNELAAIAKQSGTPDIPGLKMVWLSPWGDVAKAHPWRNIIVHQTEGPAGSGRGGAPGEGKKPRGARGLRLVVTTRHEGRGGR